jgi:predicted metal-dependent hydrolase
LLNDSFARGALLFDAGEFFEAHEVWEERWRVATDKAERDFLQGLIQVAAAFHKILEMKSEEAASRLLAKGLAKLDACPGHVEEMDLDRFRERLRACAGHLAAGQLTRATIPAIGIGGAARPGGDGEV